MISMILSVFSWFPFVGAYLLSFSGNFYFGCPVMNLPDIKLLNVNNLVSIIIGCAKTWMCAAVSMQLEAAHWTHKSNKQTEFK